MPSKHAKHKPPKEEAKSAGGGGCWLSLICYWLLGYFITLTPAGIGWWLLFVLVIPVWIGAIAARGTSRMDTPGQRFRKGFWTCGIPMFVYVGIRLMVAHHRVGPSGNAGGEFFAGLVAACVYTLSAGIVAGLTGMMWHRQAGQTGSEA